MLGIVRQIVEKHGIIMGCCCMAMAWLTSCVQNEILEDDQEVMRAIGFNAYRPVLRSQSAPMTKSISRLEDLEGTGDTDGFGVFSYYSDNTTYAAGSSVPNFMYNQHVTSTNGTDWTYSPLKYWPNETGANAKSDGVDYLTFFAYAPYQSAGVSPVNTAAGDPKITYTLDSENPTDLLWAVNPTTGLPYINMTKQAVNEKINFQFRHALASIRMNVQAVIDKKNPTGESVADNTRITIDKITIEAENQAKTGVLNLNNPVANVPKWENTGGAGNQTYTVNAANGNLYTPLRDAGDKKAAQQPQGVTKDKQPLLVKKDGTTQDNQVFIPFNEKQKFNVTAEYYVTTDDDDLIMTGGYWRVKNTISNTLEIDGFNQGGKQYTVDMLLGLETMKFDVSVAAWGDEENINNGDNTHVWEVNAKAGDNEQVLWDVMPEENIVGKGGYLALMMKLMNLKECLEQLENSSAKPQLIIEYEIYDMSNYRIGVHLGDNKGALVEYTNSTNSLSESTGTITFDFTVGSTARNTFYNYVKWSTKANSTYADEHPNELDAIFSLFIRNARIKKVTYVPA
ncbi:MAG: hypothetical protein ILA34_02920 [Bacteroidaceae bacterium]|nr:hypothetical protein [Bacteroidaceae bacterium]